MSTNAIILLALLAVLGLIRLLLPKGSVPEMTAFVSLLLAAACSVFSTVVRAHGGTNVFTYIAAAALGVANVALIIELVRRRRARQ